MILSCLRTIASICMGLMPKGTDTYVKRFICRKQDNGEEDGNVDIIRLSPLMQSHINMLGYYKFTIQEDIDVAP